MSRISVIVPTYNRVALLLETLDSIFAQTRPADEIIVVDDGSTDDTRQTIENGYVGRNVVYVYQANARQGAARNTGQARATGDLLLFLDADDCLHPHALDRLERALNTRPDACLAYGRARIIGPEGQITQPRWEKEDFEGVGSALWPRLMESNFLCTPGCVLLRRALLEPAGSPTWDAALVGVEDWDLWLRLAETGAAFVRAAADPLLDYRVHAGANSQDQAARQQMVLRVYDKHLARPYVARDPARRARVATLRETLAARLARGSTIAPELARLSGRHRFFRRLIETTGLAALYRRVPLSTRLRLRARLGIDRWA